ncbi:hypothetical protein HN018_00725 [Lichenicola cladoniae]|uniref:Uncharacterized protein n=1 Tax=Lichenicola cladoniae TaxID=1484109 RepID=A0A6M8HHH5_9PROT|nr:hypothetical protein [Lichenicola cladoniae]NPD65167.1 hypothetical protein [Acetobacteraceae bacterium]QKE88769.1 hypothetical protein HN018_00725 [Lichenicola cladoniae]
MAPLVVLDPNLRTPIRASTIKMEDTLRIVRRSCSLIARAMLVAPSRAQIQEMVSRKALTWLAAHGADGWRAGEPVPG